MDSLDIRIVASATQFEGDLCVTSSRHTDPKMYEQNKKYGDGKKGIQGFVDQYGTFYTREEALVIATKAGQLEGRTKTNPSHKLFSEDLW